MKKIVYFLYIAFNIIGLYACTLPKKDPTPSGGISSGGSTSSGSTSGGTTSSGTSLGGNASTLGVFTFFTKSDLGQGKIYIYLDNVLKGSIIHYNINGVTCGSGDVNVSLPAGTHKFTASSDGGSSWASDVKFTNNTCNTMELVKTNNGGSTTGGGTTSGGTTGGGTTSTTGTRSFFMQTDLGHGKVKIYVDNVFRGTISRSHSTYVCGQVDVNVVLSEGSHSYVADADDGWEWKGSFTIIRGQCSATQLIN